MRLGNLAAEDKADAGSAGFGREERNEQVCGICQTGTFVLDPYIDVTQYECPTGGDMSAGLESGVNSIADQVDQELFDLIGIRLRSDFKTAVQLHLQPRLESGCTPDEQTDINGLQFGLRQASQ